MLQYYFQVCMSRQRVIRKDRLSQSQLESNFEFCRRRFRGQRLAIIQGREQTRGAVLQQCLFGRSYRFVLFLCVRVEQRSFHRVQVTQENPTKPTKP